MTAALPSLVGYRPDEAEQIAAALGITLVWIDFPTPRWLPPSYESRVGRQRLRSDGTLELLRILVPIIPSPDSSA